MFSTNCLGKFNAGFFCSLFEKYKTFGLKHARSLMTQTETFSVHCERISIFIFDKDFATVYQSLEISEIRIYKDFCNEFGLNSWNLQGFNLVHG